MTDWNPTDDELRTMASASTTMLGALARLVLREREATAEAYGKGQEVFRRRTEKAEADLTAAQAAIGRVEALHQPGQASGCGCGYGVLECPTRVALTPPAAEVDPVFHSCEIGARNGCTHPVHGATPPAGGSGE